MRIHLVVVDPQNDFCISDNGHGNKGTLVVPGGKEDMLRVAAMVERLGGKLDDIHVTLDSHRTVGIERPKWWKRVPDGTPPAPFTALDVHPDGKRIVKYVPAKAGMEPTDEEYTTYLPSLLHKGPPTGEGAFGYTKLLKTGGRYPLVVWPVHCVIGTWGWGIVPELSAALCAWEQRCFARVDYVVKGTNPYTEHFSGVKAEVPDPSDPGTLVNTRFVQMLLEADIVAVCGEALSHCVANTVRDIASEFKDDAYIRKLVLLTDATSNVSGFEKLGENFLRDMTTKGMQTSTTTDFLA